MSDSAKQNRPAKYEEILKIPEKVVGEIMVGSYSSAQDLQANMLWPQVV